MSQRIDETGDLFYTRLFELDPALKALFRDDKRELSHKFIRTIGTAVASLELPKEAIPAIRHLGRRHTTYGVKKEHYATMREALLWSLQQVLGEDFTPAVQEAWAAAYDTIARLAIEAGYD